MQFKGSVHYFADSSLVAGIYRPTDKSLSRIALTVEDKSDKLSIDSATVFIPAKYEKHLEAAVAAFNAAWESVEKQNLVEHE